MDAFKTVVIALLAWAFALVIDRAQYMVHIGAARASTMAAWYWGALPLTLLFAAVLMASIWAIGFRPRSPRWLGLPVAVVALLLLVGLPFLTTGLAPFEALMRRPLIRSEFLLREAAATSFFMIQTCAVLLAGLLALFRRTNLER